MHQKRIGEEQLELFLFATFPTLFYSVLLAIRLRLVDLEGGKATQELLRRILPWGEPNQLGFGKLWLTPLKGRR